MTTPDTRSTVNIKYIPRLLFGALQHFTRGDDESAALLYNLVHDSRWVWGEPKAKPDAQA